MAILRVNNFKGRILRYPPDKIPESNAVTCINAELLNTALEPFNANTTVNTPTKVGTIQTIYRWAPTAGNPSSGYWFHWTEDVDVVRSPIGGNATDRVIFTGQTEPRITDNSIATSGGTNYPENWYILGVPAPATPPTATLTAGGSCDVADQTDTVYVMTYVSAWGEEGPPSDASNQITARCPGHQVDLTNLATAPAGNYNITNKRIYRAYNGNYYLVAEIAVATTTYSDTKTDADLGVELPSLDWTAPPTSMKGVVAMPNGIVVGFSGNEVIPSEAYQPHAFPTANRQSVDWDIVGLGVFGQNLFVGTEGNPYIASGVSSEGMILDKLELDQACVSKRSITPVGANGVIYASPDGLVMVSLSGAEIITEGVITREQWQDNYYPNTIHGYAHEGRYYGFYDNGSTLEGFVFDLRDKSLGFIDLDLAVTAGYQDMLTDDLYLMIGSNIVRFNDAAGLMTYTWRSKTFRFPKPTGFACGTVYANDYTDIEVRLFGGGVRKATVFFANNASTPTANATGDLWIVPDSQVARRWNGSSWIEQSAAAPPVYGSDAFRFPATAPETEWFIEIVGSSTVTEVSLAASMQELNQV